MQIGPYEVTRSLGGGGMSEALLARSPQGKIVVLKRPLKREPELLARLRDEARLGSRLYHPHLVETLDVIEHDGLPIVALGYVDGPTVDELRKAGPLGPAAAARVGCHVAEALTALHGALGDDGRPMRAVHRDVTARNIVVRTDGEAVLIDLGIAKSDEDRNAKTETGMVLGTLRYLAPEIIDGREATTASDVWALACVVYECATGVVAFAGSPGEVAGRITGVDPLAQPAASGLAPALKAVLARMFVKDPAQRMREAHEVSSALRAVEDALGGGKTELAQRATLAASMVNTTKQPAPDSGPIAPLAPAPVTGVAGRAPTESGPMAPLASLAPPQLAPPPAAPLQAAPLAPPPAHPFVPPPQPQPHAAQFAPPQAAHFAPPQVAQFAPPPAAPFAPPHAAQFAPPHAAPFAPPPAPSSGQPQFDRPPPRAPQPGPRAPVVLELDRAPARKPTMEGPKREDFYPKKRLDLSWLNTTARVAFWIVVVGGGYAGYRYWDAQEQAAAKAAADWKRAEDDRLLKDAMKDTGARCDGSDSGDGWAYEDARGTTVVVESLSQVPKRFVKTARCVRVGSRR
jgi:serine/threonine-protein kinase